MEVTGFCRFIPGILQGLSESLYFGDAVRGLRDSESNSDFSPYSVTGFVVGREVVYKGVEYL